MNRARRDTEWLANNRPAEAPPHCPINNPGHYTAGRLIEPINVIEDWELSFHLGNALKYISRAGRKDPEKYRQDLSKAVWYLERELDRVVEEEQAEADVPFYDAMEWADEYAEEIFAAEREFWAKSQERAPERDFWAKDHSKFQDDEVVTSFVNKDGSITGRTKHYDEVVLKGPTHDDVITFFDWHEETPCDV